MWTEVYGLWGRREEALHPRGDDGRWRSKLQPSSTRMTEDNFEGGEPGQVLAVSKDGKRRLRQGPNFALFEEERQGDDWVRVARHTNRSFTYGKDAPVRKTKWMLLEGGPKQADYAPPNRPADVVERFGKATTGLEALDAVPLSIRSDLSRDEREEFEDYRVEGYERLNEILRWRPTTAPRAMDRAMERSRIDRDVLVHRGIKRGENVFGDAWSDRPGTLVGMEYRDDAYSSTSAVRRVVNDFTDEEHGAVLNILVPSGTNAFAYDSEAEILLPRSTKFRIVADYMENGARTLDVEVIP